MPNQNLHGHGVPKNGVPKKCLVALVLLLFFFGFAPPVTAHKVIIFAWVEGDMVHSESKFSGGKPIKEGDILVYDETDTLLLQGKTDDQGGFSFPLPKAPPLIVELNAGMGHMARWELEPEDGAGVPFQPDTAESEIPAPAAPDKGKKSLPSGGNMPPAEQTQALETMIEKALDKKLKPVMTLLGQMQDTGPSFSDIMGGIGYIVGLVGLGAYLKSRQPKP
jgi:nickel transport protein